MIRNPFRKPYVFSKKWALWITIGIPLILYIDLTDSNAKRSDDVSTSTTVILIFLVIPWITVRIVRAFQGKSPQGKTYNNDGEVIEGEVLNLKFGYRPRVLVQARLLNGVVEFPTDKIAIEEIESIKLKDPRPLSHKFSAGLVGASLYSLMIYLDWRLAYNYLHSLGILHLFVSMCSVFLLLTIIMPIITKQNLVIKSYDGKTIIMPFSKSLNGLSAMNEITRINRFKKKVKKAQKRLAPKR